MDQFGVILREARTLLGFSASHLNQELFGQSGTSYYYQIETGPRCPNRKTIEALSKKMGINYEILAKLIIQRHVANLTEYFFEERNGNSKARSKPTTNEGEADS